MRKKQECTHYLKVVTVSWLGFKRMADSETGSLIFNDDITHDANDEMNLDIYQSILRALVA